MNTDEYRQFTPVRPTERTRAVLRTLFQRRHEAARLPPMAAELDGWRPVADECFENAAKWVAVHSHHSRVCGFLVLNYLPWGLAFVRFTPYCAVEVSESLVDITPRSSPGDTPFLRHRGTPDEFQSLLVEQGNNLGLDLILP